MPRATFTALSFLRVLVASTREVRVRVSTMMPPVARSEAMASRNAAVSTESATPMFGAASAKNAAFSIKSIEVRAARLRSPFVSGLGDASSGKSSAMARRRAIFSCASRGWGLGAGVPASVVPGFGVVEDIGYLRMLLSHPSNGLMESSAPPLAPHDVDTDAARRRAIRVVSIGGGARAPPGQRDGTWQSFTAGVLSRSQRLRSFYE